MAFYIYIDEKTGEHHEIMMTMSEMLRRQDSEGNIEHEGKTLKRSVVAEHRGVPGCSTNWPMMSDSAGVHPSQCKKAWEESLGMKVPTQFHPETGQAIFESRSHRKAFLKAKGMYDRNGGYGD